MKKRLFAVMVLAAAGMLLMAGLAGAAARESLSEEVTLYRSPGPKDPFTMFYDIKVKAPGVIRVGVQVLNVSPAKDAPRRLVGIGLLGKGDKRAIRQDICGLEGGKFEYVVDALELERTHGDYRIIISNFSRKHTVTAKLAARYPGDADSAEAESSSAPRTLDLKIGAISLDPNGCIAVEVINSGTIPLPASVWTDRKPESTSVLLEIDGKNWGGATIWSIDPDRILRMPGARIVYHSTCRVTGPVKVRAFVDRTRQLREQDERNNVKEVMLQP